MSKQVVYISIVFVLLTYASIILGYGDMTWSFFDRDFGYYLFRTYDNVADLIACVIIIGHLPGLVFMTILIDRIDRKFILSDLSSNTVKNVILCGVKPFHIYTASYINSHVAKTKINSKLFNKQWLIYLLCMIGLAPLMLAVLHYKLFIHSETLFHTKNKDEIRDILKEVDLQHENGTISQFEYNEIMQEISEKMKEIN